MVTFGVRTLLLMLATLVFVLAVFVDDNYADLIAWGLAAIVFSFLLADIGWDRNYGIRR